MTTANWIPLDHMNLGHATISHGGVETFSAPSPYDVPDAIAVESDADRSVLTILFRYLEPERTEKVVIRKDITFFVGRHTQRLYGIEITMNNVRKMEALRRAFEEALQVMAANVPKTRKANFKAAREAVEASSDELMRVAAAY